MKHLNLKTVICILASLVLVGSVSIGLTACKKNDTAETEQSGRTIETTEALTPEQRAEMEKQLEKDDNVVEDPFDEDDDASGSKETAAAKSGSKETAAAKSGSKETAAAKSGSKETAAAKSGSKETATQNADSGKKKTAASANTDTGKKRSRTGSGAGVLVTDESGNLWTGWY